MCVFFDCGLKKYGLDLVAVGREKAAGLVPEQDQYELVGWVHPHHRFVGAAVAKTGDAAAISRRPLQHRPPEAVAIGVIIVNPDLTGFDRGHLPHGSFRQDALTAVRAAPEDHLAKSG